jgi:hypothetical protein
LARLSNFAQKEKKIFLEFRIKLFELMDDSDPKLVDEMRDLVDDIDINGDIVKQGEELLDKVKGFDKIGDELSVGVLALAVAMVQKKNRLYGIHTRKSKIKRAISKGIKLNLSEDLYGKNKKILRLMEKEIKNGILKGESISVTAGKLLKINKPSVKIPKHIKAMRDAARAAIIDPKDYVLFKDTIRKYEKLINNLAEKGGIKSATTEFKRQLERELENLDTASLKNIDSILDIWVERKALNRLKLIIRDETAKAFNSYHSKYMRNADHIVGEQYLLAGAHPTPDECDALVGRYFYKDNGKIPEPIVDTHPRCLCYKIPIIDPKLL